MFTTESGTRLDCAHCYVDNTSDGKQPATGFVFTENRERDTLPFKGWPLRGSSTPVPELKFT